MTDSQARLAPTTVRVPVVLLRPLAVTLVIGFALAATWLYLQSQSAEPITPPASALIGDGTGLEVAFELVDHRGQPVTIASYQGAPLLVVFGYTSCPDVCPMTLARLASALEGLESDGMLAQGVFITVDPIRDTPEVLASYVAAFHERLSGLTGDDRGLRQATQSFRVFYEKVGEGDDDYFMDHSAYIYLLGPGGDLLSYYHPDLDSEALLTDIRKRLSRRM